MTAVYRDVKRELRTVKGTRAVYIDKNKMELHPLTDEVLLNFLEEYTKKPCDIHYDGVMFILWVGDSEEFINSDLSVLREYVCDFLNRNLDDYDFFLNPRDMYEFLQYELKFVFNDAEEKLKIYERFADILTD
jgi:hypothetical protein